MTETDHLKIIDTITTTNLLISQRNWHGLENFVQHHNLTTPLDALSILRSTFPVRFFLPNWAEVRDKAKAMHDPDGSSSMFRGLG